MACDKVRQGNPIEEPIQQDDAYKRRAQCLTYNGMFVRLENGDAKRFHPIAMDVGGDGIYTFLFDQSGSLHTAKVANQFEMGSLHLTLAFESKAKRVLSAGEMEKKGNTIQFNLLSGTFMKQWMNEELEGECDENVKDLTVELFSKAGLNAVYKDQPFIAAKNVPVTKEQLDSYIDAGFQVKLFKERGSCLLEPTLVMAKINQWKGKEMYADEIRKHEAMLEKAKDFILYTKGGKRLLTKRGRAVTRRRDASFRIGSRALTRARTRRTLDRRYAKKLTTRY